MRGTYRNTQQPTRAQLTLFGKRLVVRPIHDAWCQRIGRHVLHLSADAELAARGREDVVQCGRRNLGLHRDRGREMASEGVGGRGLRGMHRGLAESEFRVSSSEAGRGVAGGGSVGHERLSDGRGTLNGARATTANAREVASVKDHARERVSEHHSLMRGKRKEGRVDPLL